MSQANLFISGLDGFSLICLLLSVKIAFWDQNLLFFKDKCDLFEEVFANNFVVTASKQWLLLVVITCGS